MRRKDKEERSEEEQIQNFLAWAEKLGYAVAVFTPEELGGSSAKNVEEAMIERGWEAIEG